MKVLTLTQPWATLCLGPKNIETRSWYTNYRGPVAIHAALGFPSWAKSLCLTTPFCDALARLGIRRPEELPLGVILCVRSIERCQRTEELARSISELERAFGDYSANRHGFGMGPITRVFTPPIPARGALGFWNWDPPAGAGQATAAAGQGSFVFSTSPPEEGKS